MAVKGDFEFGDIIYEKHKRKQGVAWISINKPQALNAFSSKTLGEMCVALNDAGRDGSVGVIVLTGVGDRSFSAGGDVKWEKEQRPKGGAHPDTAPMPDIRNAMKMCLKPIIARVNGYAIGGGNWLAYFCDLTIASEHSVFGQNGPVVGSPAGDLPVTFLTHIVGHKRAREIWYTCRRYTAKQYYDWGLVNSVVPKEKLDEEVDKWCDEILGKCPTCLKVLKASFESEFNYLRIPDATTQRLIARDFFDSEESLEGAQAFLDKRKPNWTKYRK